MVPNIPIPVGEIKYFGLFKDPNGIFLYPDLGLNKYILNPNFFWCFVPKVIEHVKGGGWQDPPSAFGGGPNINVCKGLFRSMRLKAFVGASEQEVGTYNAYGRIWPPITAYGRLCAFSHNTFTPTREVAVKRTNL